MKINFTELQPKDINGTVIEIKNLHKILANYIYSSTKVLDLIDIAISINRGEELEITEKLLKIIRNMVISEKSPFYAFVQVAILEHIDTALMV